MWREVKRMPSGPTAIAFTALLIALSGTAVALPGKNKVDSGDIKNGQVKSADIGTGQVKAGDLSGGAVNGAKVTDNSLRGGDINESSLGKVPSAGNADSATTAANAANADKVDGKDASELDSNGFHAANEGFVDLPASTVTNVQTLNLPVGAFLIYARLSVNNNGGESDDAVECKLQAGTVSQTVGDFFLGANLAPGETEETSLQIASTLGAPGQAVLSCDTAPTWGGGNAQDPTISAISVASIN